MSQRVTQRELRNDSGRIMRALDRGKTFIVTRNGVPVGELIPLRQRRFVPAEVVLAAFAGAPRLARARFRRDVDALVDQDVTPVADARVRGIIDTSVLMPEGRGSAHRGDGNGKRASAVYAPP